MSRITKNIPFSMIPNSIIVDLSISAPALRMYIYLFSKPNGWNVNNKDIMKSLNIGSNNTISKYWKELLSSGWVVRHQDRANGKFSNKYIYEFLSSPILGNLTEIAKSDNSELPKSQCLRNRNVCEIAKSANYNNKERVNKKENINNNSLSISLTKKEKREENFTNLSFKEFRSNLINKYSGYVFIKYNDEYISLSDSGFLELNSKIVKSEKAFELWNYLYQNRVKLEPMSKKQLENILMDIKSKKSSKIEAIKQKIEIIKNKYFLNVLTGKTCSISFIEILEDSKVKFQFNDDSKRFVLSDFIDNFIKYDSYRIDNIFLWCS